MKAKNKGETKKSAQNKKLAYVVIAVIAVIIAVIIVASIFSYIYPNQPSQPKAAIIDPLSSLYLEEPIRHKNQTFINTTKELLYKRFSTVD
jgi:cytochrome c-type biogenesis protein CcmH/NrfG